MQHLLSGGWLFCPGSSLLSSDLIFHPRGIQAPYIYLKCQPGTTDLRPAENLSGVCHAIHSCGQPGRLSRQGRTNTSPPQKKKRKKKSAVQKTNKDADNQASDISCSAENNYSLSICMPPVSKNRIRLCGSDWLKTFRGFDWPTVSSPALPSANCLLPSESGGWKLNSLES